MENKKISLQELTDTIASQSGFSKRFTESFLRELVLVIQENLEKDGVVKVKGLGTFKLLWNEPRKSVDVSTGNSIVLPGFYKVSFAADAGIKEQINAPYAHLDTVMGGAEVISEVEDEEDTDNGELRVEKGESNELQDELMNGEINSPTHQLTASPERSEINSESPNNQITASPERSDSNSASPSKKKWWVAMVVLMLLCLLGAAGFYWRNVLIPQQNTMSPADIKAPVVVVRVDTIDNLVADTMHHNVLVPADTVKADPEITLETYTYKDALNAPVRETVTVIDGSRLTMVAYRAYGHKAFWVYVYDANRNVLSSPNAVEKGMELVIPDLPKSIVNPKSKLCLDKAYELAKQY
ncbi:MAG: HU family DNA-binding protein [Paludibacteraceae bacterium]|nr:HU family DNA-binding protein [Paludibacteraceae bacterium]